ERSFRLSKILLCPLAISSRIVSRRLVSASPAVNLPARSMISTEFARLVVTLKSIGFHILPLLGHPLDDRFKNRIRIDAFSLAFEIQNHPMAQRRQDHMPYIFVSDFGAAAEQRSHFASDDQSLRAARAGAIP